MAAAAAAASCGRHPQCDKAWNRAINETQKHIKAAFSAFFPLLIHGGGINDGPGTLPAKGRGRKICDFLQTAIKATILAATVAKRKFIVPACVPASYLKLNCATATRIKKKERTKSSDVGGLLT